MDQIQMISYRRWRNRLIKKGLSEIGSTGGESFKSVAKKIKKYLTEENILNYNEKKGLTSLDFDKKIKNKEINRLVKNLAEIYRKERIFRQEKIKRIKNLIKKGEYKVTGKMIIDKWFPEDQVF